MEGLNNLVVVKKPTVMSSWPAGRLFYLKQKAFQFNYYIGRIVSAAATV